MNLQLLSEKRQLNQKRDKMDVKQWCRIEKVHRTSCGGSQRNVTRGNTEFWLAVFAIDFYEYS